MRRDRNRPLGSSLVPVLLILPALHAQQVADPEFDVKVAKPAYTNQQPKVLFDVAHHISVLHFGEVLETGATAQIRSSQKVQEIYLGTA